MGSFLHAADLHLDTPPSLARGYPDHVADALRDASLDAFDNLVATAIERSVSFCLFAGDIYDGAERGVRAQLRFRDGLARLAEADIPSFVVHGNHDPVDEGWSAVRTWPEQVTVFAPGEPQTVVVSTSSGEVAVQGVSYASRAEHENLALRFRPMPGVATNVGLLHANVGANPDHAPYAPATIEELRSVGLDYWALGHIHRRATLGGPAPWIVYPGNLQGRSPKPSEQGAKGAVVVSVEPGGHIVDEPELVELDVVRFAQLDVPVDGVADLGDLTEALTAAVDGLAAQNAGRSLVLRLTLTGRGPVSADLARDEAVVEMRDHLQRVDQEPFVWCDRIENRSGPEVDWARLAETDDFVAHVVRRLDPASSGVEPGTVDVAEALDQVLDRLPPEARSALDEVTATPAELTERARVVAYEALEGS